MEKIKVRGLVSASGMLFLLWGGVVMLRGLWDIAIGEPEANRYSLQKWEFVSRQQWATWSGFEIVYGLACIAAAFLLWKYARRLPEHIERPAPMQ